MDLSVEGLLIKEVLRRTERDLIRRGVLPKKVLPLRKVDFNQVVGYTYNRYFKTFVNRSVYASDEDYSKLIEELFLSKERVHLRGGLRNLSSSYTHRKVNGRHVFMDSVGEEVTFTKIETLILHYERGKNLQNYLITAIRNKITTFKKVHIESVNKRVDHDLLPEEYGDSLITGVPVMSDDYKYLLEEVVNRSRVEIFYEEEELPEKHFIEALIDLRVGYGLTVPDIAGIVKRDFGKVSRIWEIVMDTIYEVYKEYDRESAERYFKNSSLKDMSEADVKKSISYSDLFPEIPLELREKIDKCRRAHVDR